MPVPFAMGSPPLVGLLHDLRRGDYRRPAGVWRRIGWPL